ncbi:MAG: 4-phosphoerythronate dehydrogenase PdxB [Planctomycetota bacterium]|jgi:erythronate-4-phosphate dehydrogenase
MKIVADQNIPFVSECFSSIGEATTLPGREITRKSVAQADVLLVRSITRVDSNLLCGSKVRFVATATIGFEHIDTEYLAESNIGFASAPGSNANSVGEYVVAALLSIGKKYKIELEGKSIGIVGVGNVGSRVEKKAKALGMQVYLNDPPLQRQTGDRKYLPLEELFGCDFITLHTPLTFEGTDKTFHLADEKFFGSLRSGCIFVNTARGGVTNTRALKAAIKSGKLGGAILDVWENEPNIDVELLQVADLATPHIAGYSLDGKVAGTIMIYEAVCKHFGFEPEYGAQDFLPEPKVEYIEVDAGNRDEQEALHETVQQVHTINTDDSNTREIATVPEGRRGKCFDDLRKNYPERREFHNTEVVVKNPRQSLVDKLRGIGFKVSDGRK